jgi:hypothetical protein
MGTIRFRNNKGTGEERVPQHSEQGRKHCKKQAANFSIPVLTSISSDLMVAACSHCWRASIFLFRAMR